MGRNDKTGRLTSRETLEVRDLWLAGAAEARDALACRDFADVVPQRGQACLPAMHRGALATPCSRGCLPSVGEDAIAQSITLCGWPCTAASLFVREWGPLAIRVDLASQRISSE